MRIQPMNGVPGCSCHNFRTKCVAYFRGINDETVPCHALPGCSDRIFPLVKRSKLGRFHFPVSVS